MREAVSAIYETVASSTPWVQGGLPFSTQLNHILSSDSPVPKGADKQLRGKILPTLRQHVELIKEQLSRENEPDTGSSQGANVLL